eukprot:CAMPEP_0198276228 /NCGR_PEP_ID=MMETSP1447-20131203/65202_1 /TAXON_ID=420782 /ORGANISM="Chaetoceros dichaeta, Strain CCMP1751" /LENGTH=227 /DNA_ID=CAMNT_0043971163 /DNA_START=62 /DNA_END=747 /DNA_ORIENTATION=+
MGFLHLFIVNKSGGLIHHRALGPRAPTIGTNDWLRIGSTFHSLHAIATEANPVRATPSSTSSGADDGINMIEASGLLLCCLQTRTGVKFVITAEPGTRNSKQVLRELYVLYSECALNQYDEASGLLLCCLQTRTGVKFVITPEPGTRNPKQVLRELYVLYSECALKDPFYELDMPIRCELFTDAVDALMARMQSSSKSTGGGGIVDGVLLSMVEDDDDEDDDDVEWE